MFYSVCSVFVIQLCFSLLISVLGCMPKIIHNQNLYCQAEYVFEARVIRWIDPYLNQTNNELLDTLSNKTYEVMRFYTYKNTIELLQVWTDEIFVEDMCDTWQEKLSEGQTYVFYANKDNETDLPVVYHYRLSSTFIPKAEEILPLFDCDCQIREFFNLNSTDSSITDNSTECMAKTNITCLYDKGYCAKGDDDQCQWKVLGSCDTNDQSNSACLPTPNRIELIFMPICFFLLIHKYSQIS